MQENLPTTATAAFDYAPLVKLTTAMGITLADINTTVTLLGGLVTVIYGCLKIYDWYDARKHRSEERRSLRALWKKLQLGQPPTNPVPFDSGFDQSHHDGKH